MKNFNDFIAKYYFNEMEKIKNGIIPQGKKLKDFEYEIFATDYFHKINVDFNIIYTGFRKYFKDDKEERNTYVIEVFRRENPNKIISFDFGDAIMNNDKQHPSLYSIASTIGFESNDPETFEDFCMRYGYNEDSRKSLETYLECQDLYKKITSFFTEEEIEYIQENFI